MPTYWCFDPNYSKDLKSLVEWPLNSHLLQQRKWSNGPLKVILTRVTQNRIDFHQDGWSARILTRYTFFFSFPEIDCDGKMTNFLTCNRSMLKRINLTTFLKSICCKNEDKSSLVREAKKIFLRRFWSLVCCNKVSTNASLILDGNCCSIDSKVAHSVTFWLFMVFAQFSAGKTCTSSKAIQGRSPPPSILFFEVWSINRIIKNKFE